LQNFRVPRLRNALITFWVGYYTPLLVKKNRFCHSRGHLYRFYHTNSTGSATPGSATPEDVCTGFTIQILPVLPLPILRFCHSSNWHTKSYFKNYKN
jgi:hypothetical protein